MQFRGFAVVICALAIAPAAFAQETTPPPTPAATAQRTFSAMPNEPEGFTITPFLGLGFAGDFENNPTALGLAAGYGLNERLSIEGDLYFAAGGEQSDLDDVIHFDTSVWSLSGNLLYHFTGEDFTPYVVGGVGVMAANADAEALGVIADDTSTEFAWNWGAGIKSAMSDRWGLRADLRFFNGDELAPDHWRLFGGVTIRNIGR
jgi:opacity protein-like surface antigen